MEANVLMNRYSQYAYSLPMPEKKKRIQPWPRVRSSRTRTQWRSWRSSVWKIIMTIRNFWESCCALHCTTGQGEGFTGDTKTDKAGADARETFLGIQTSAFRDPQQIFSDSGEEESCRDQATNEESQTAARRYPLSVISSLLLTEHQKQEIFGSGPAENLFARCTVIIYCTFCRFNCYSKLRATDLVDKGDSSTTMEGQHVGCPTIQTWILWR